MVYTPTPAPYPSRIQGYRAADVIMDPATDFEEGANKAPTYLENWNYYEAARNKIDIRREEILNSMMEEKRRLVRERDALSHERRRLEQMLNLHDPEEEEALARRDPTGVYVLSEVQCSALLAKLMNTAEASFYFNHPVDPVAMGIPHYPQFVRHPMDFGTIKSKLDSGGYRNDTDYFIADVRLVFRNCFTFNGPEVEANRFAKTLEALFEAAIRDPTQIRAVKTKTKFQPFASLPSTTPSSRSVLKKSKRISVEADDSGELDTTIGGGGGDELGVLAIRHMKTLCNSLLKNPQLIHNPKLSFFRDFLTTFDFQ
jgi:hypothetical protein